MKSTALTKCHISNCLGHHDERTAAVRCTRCERQLWTLIRPASAPDPSGYFCLRCRAALAGRNVVDPLVTDARRAQLAQARNRHDQPIQQGKAGGIPLESEEPVVPAPSRSVERRLAVQRRVTIPRQFDGDSLNPQPGPRPA